MTANVQYQIVGILIIYYSPLLGIDNVEWMLYHNFQSIVGQMYMSGKVGVSVRVQSGLMTHVYKVGLAGAYLA